MSISAPMHKSWVHRIRTAVAGLLVAPEYHWDQGLLITTDQVAQLTSSRAAGIGLILCVLAVWALEHPYLGLLHDASFYALGAFARLHPQSLGRDIFLSSGTQNHYTIFSLVVAPLMRMMGVGRSAALVTLINQVLFFGGCVLVARRVMPTSLSILSIAALASLPSLYGDRHIFWFTETLMTARVSAEAFVMVALAWALERRFVLMTLCLALAALFHPILALAGFVFLFLLFVGMRRRRLTLALAVGGLAVLFIVSRVAPHGRVALFDPRWLDFLRKSFAYLFPSLWSLGAWGRMAIPSATLAVGALILEPSPCRRLCRAALATAILGLSLSLVGSDLLHIVIVAQIQPWRWLWLSNALAILLLPVIGLACWKRNTTSRAALLLVAGAWISFNLHFGGLIAVMAVGTAVLARRSTGDRATRWILIGSFSIGLASLSLLIRSTLLSLAQVPAPQAGLTLLESMDWVVANRWLPWTNGGVVPACGFLGLWWLARHRTDSTRLRDLLIVTVGSVLCITAAPYAWRSWTNFAPTERLQAHFASWRKVIPKKAQVFDPMGPLVPWFLLERPSYWSVPQMTGAVFSRSTTMELLRRHALLARALRTARPKDELRTLCAADHAIDFIVTPRSMGPTPLKPIDLGDGPVHVNLRLYSCSVQPGESGKSTAPPPTAHPS